MRKLSTVLAWVVALGVGAIVGVVAGKVFVHPVGTELGPPGDRVQEAVAGLKKEHFYVAPEMRSRLTEAQTEEISEAVSHGKVPTYLIYWTDSTDAGYYLDSEALDQVIEGVGVDGHYAIVNQTQDATTGSRGMNDAFVERDTLAARVDQALLGFGTALAHEKREPVERSDYWGGAGGGAAAGALFAGGGFLVLLGVVALVGLLRPRRPAGTGADR